MNLYTSNFKLLNNSIIRSLVITLSLLTSYYFLICLKIVKPSAAQNQWEDNFIKVQNYSYRDLSNTDMVMVGSSLTANIHADDIGSHVINLGQSGGCSQTGLEAVLRKDKKTKLLLVEINDTIDRKIDSQVIESIYNPLLYMFRMSKIRQHGTHVILFNVPGDSRVKNTLYEKQVRVLMEKLFPPDKFEWLAEPASRQWKTLDGYHLIRSDAQDYATFLRNQLLSIPKRRR